MLSLILSLVYFGLSDLSVLGLLKLVALGGGLSLLIAFAYPEIRGVKKGDEVVIVQDAATPGFLGKVGRALHNAKKMEKIRIRLDNGREILGVVEDHGGIISPPKVRMIYEERLIE